MKFVREHTDLPTSSPVITNLHPKQSFQFALVKLVLHYAVGKLHQKFSFSENSFYSA